ncbi:MAG: PH domain-containing protein [Chloroflexi bacterium]|nr:PH domain-containing protein [Chloroflexota bacterium]
MMLHGLFGGNASEFDVREVQRELDALLVEGEQLRRGFRIVRDLFLFTDRRLILVDRQGMSGRKTEYHSIPYRSITHFSIETAGLLDGDAELVIYLSGALEPVRREFKRGSDILGVSRLLAQGVLR